MGARPVLHDRGGLAVLVTIAIADHQGLGHRGVLAVASRKAVNGTSGFLDRFIKRRVCPCFAVALAAGVALQRFFQRVCNVLRLPKCVCNVLLNVFGPFYNSISEVP